MSAPLPTSSGPQCGWGFCEKPATHHVVVHYPAGISRSGRPFDYPGFRCDADLAQEIESATTVNATVDVTPLLAQVVAS